MLRPELLNSLGLDQRLANRKRDQRSWLSILKCLARLFHLVLIGIEATRKLQAASLVSAAALPMSATKASWCFRPSLCRRSLSGSTARCRERRQCHLQPAADAARCYAFTGERGTFISVEPAPASCRASPRSCAGLRPRKVPCLEISSSHGHGLLLPRRIVQVIG